MACILYGAECAYMCIYIKSLTVNLCLVQVFSVSAQLNRAPPLFQLQSELGRIRLFIKSELWLSSIKFNTLFKLVKIHASTPALFQDQDIQNNQK